MDAQTLPEEPEGRPAGGTELSWCKAVPGGTGITVLALLLSRPIDPSLLETTLHRLQNSHPILRTRLTLHSPSRSNNNHPFYSISPNPHLRIKTLDASATAEILDRHSGKDRIAISPFHSLLEYELNQNPWVQADTLSTPPRDLFFATFYTVPCSESSFVALRFHTSVCDRTSGVSILRQLLRLIEEIEEERECSDDHCRNSGDGRREEFTLGIEDLIPGEHLRKPFWAKGRDLIGYSLNFKRSSSLAFEDAGSPRSSEVVRLELSAEETRKLLSGCRAKGIKLCAALVAAGLIVAVSSKHTDNNHRSETYSVVTLVDCRRYLDPPLHDHNLGFYHSAIQNTHTVHGGEGFWELATRCCTALSNSMSCGKHLTDMGELNFLMCKAIDNPHLTASSSMRTALISVFEDPVASDSCESCRRVGVEEYMGCASVHGVGPSVAVFDTVRDGRLDCACVYPSPLHSREQMQGLVEDMKRILKSGGCEAEQDGHQMNNGS